MVKSLSCQSDSGGSQGVNDKATLSMLRAPKIIKIGSDFTGMDSIMTAVARFLPSEKYQVLFQSDTSKAAQKLLVKNLIT